MDKSSIAKFLVQANAFAPFRFLNRDRLLVLMYHRFGIGEEFGKTSLKALQNHLGYLQKNYKVISLTEAVSYLSEGVSLPPRSAVLTIDDGYRDFYEIAFPILRQYSMPATLYAVTDFIDGTDWIWTDKARFILTRTNKADFDFSINETRMRASLDSHESRLAAAGKINAELKMLSDELKNEILLEFSSAMNIDIPALPQEGFRPFEWDDAREMQKFGMTIGSHTKSHPILTNVDAERLRAELQDSRHSIQDKLQIDEVHFCYPNGNVSVRERDAVEAAGYASAVTTEIRLCEKIEDKFLIPRIDAEPELHRFVQATSGFDRIK